MTNEEKQALIEYAKSWIADAEAARDDIPFGFDEDTEMELSLIKIALAALTTQPDDWQQRAEAAEAAEAKLAELEKQEAVAEVNHDGTFYGFKALENMPEGNYELFTRPAPAINRAELVLDENDNPQGFTDWYEHHFATQPYKGASHVTDCENAWRAAILRHIEEAG